MGYLIQCYKRNLPELVAKSQLEVSWFLVTASVYFRLYEVYVSKSRDNVIVKVYLSKI